MSRIFTVASLALLVLALPFPAYADVLGQQITIRDTPGDDVPVFAKNRETKTGTGRIRGRVVALDSGAPVRRAQVRISGAEISPKAALTDAEGRYEFRDLPAGRFNLTVTKSGFVMMRYGQNRPFEPGRPIQLAEAQVIDKADIVLPRGSVVSGRVIDELGEPVADAMVSALRMQFANGRRRLMNVGRLAQTNDLGQFRLYGLAPGEYYVSATLRANDMMMFDMSASQGGPVGSNPSSGYAPTYYPGTPNTSDAQRVTVAVGQEVGSIDIALQPVKLAKVSGTALSSEGKPIAGAMVMLMPSSRDTGLFMPGGTSRTGRDGQFTLSNVVPGDYLLQVRSLGGVFTADVGGGAMVFSMADEGPGAPPPSRQEPEFGNLPLSVAGEDVTGLIVVTTHGARATGRLVFEGGAKPDGIAAVRVMAPPADPEGVPVPGIGNAPVKQNGAFEITGLAGTRGLRPTNLPKGWYLKSVRINGIDVTDSGFEFKPAEEVSGIEIEVTQRTTVVAGGVMDARGQPVKDYTVVVFPDDQQKWTLPLNRWTSAARPDQDGKFSVTNLPAGVYYAIALEYVVQGEWGDPEWLERARSRAIRFTLDDGATHTLKLKLSAM